MKTFTQTLMAKCCSVLVLTAFVFTTVFLSTGFAQVAAVMPPPGVMVSTSEVFDGAHVLGLQVDAQDPFHIDFMINHGQDKLAGDDQKGEYLKLIKYFMASLTVPDKDQ